MQQINTKEESSIDHESIDNYGALLDDITASAIRNSQKKVRYLTRQWISVKDDIKNISKGQIYMKLAFRAVKFAFDMAPPLPYTYNHKQPTIPLFALRANARNVSFFTYLQ